MKFSCAAQNSTLKNHPRDILRDENHLYGIVLAHIIHKTALNTHKWDVPFGVPTNASPLRLIFSFIFNQAACLLHPTKPYRGVNFPHQHFL